MHAVERRTFRGAGVDLVGDVQGDPDGQTVLFLHGSGQTRLSWSRALTQAAERGYRAISLDLRGHGDSAWSPDGVYDLETFTSDLRSVIEDIGIAPIIVGASLGGLVGMLLAGAEPAALKALVLVDITARIEMEGSREVMDFMAAGSDGFSSLEDAADAVAAYLPHRKRPQDVSGLAKNLRLRDGRYHWHWDPAFMSMGQDTQLQEAGSNRLETAARRLAIPTLLIRGGRSRIVTAEGAREFQEMVPHADYVHISDADHMVAGDANDPFNDAVFSFIDRQFATTPMH
ncbi:MAG: alpha/beta fold hydrolase [Sphingobium sp.]